MQVITSKDNDIIKNVKKLNEKKHRDETGLYIIEGIKIITEAIEENVDIEEIIICQECLQSEAISQKLLYEIAKYNCIYVDKRVFNYLTTVVTPQGILAVVKKMDDNKTLKFTDEVILILDGIQDPGNLGTILRTVDSVNLKQIITSKNTVDVYNPKVIRSTMGAIFRVNVVESNNLIDTIKELKKNKFKVMATSLDANETIYDIDYTKKAIVIGNESNGVSKQILDIADNKVIIPMLGKTESLNASVATGIILYEYVRRKIQ